MGRASWAGRRPDISPASGDRWICLAGGCALIVCAGAVYGCELGTRGVLPGPPPSNNSRNISACPPPPLHRGGPCIRHTPPWMKAFHAVCRGRRSGEDTV